MEIKDENLAAQQRKGRMIFLAMVIFFVVPILAVILMFKYNWRPGGGSLGELVQPPRQIVRAESLQYHNGKPAAQFWRDKWSLVFVADRCEQVCMSRMHDMRQIYVSMYKDMIRVQRMLITTSAADATKVLASYPDMHVIDAPQEDVAAVAQQFNLQNENALQSNRLYLVDPLGNIMMSYPADFNAAGIRKDLAKLLRSSWAG